MGRIGRKPFPCVHDPFLIQNSHGGYFQGKKNPVQDSQEKFIERENRDEDTGNGLSESLLTRLFCEFDAT